MDSMSELRIKELEAEVKRLQELQDAWEYINLPREVPVAYSTLMERAYKAESELGEADRRAGAAERLLSYEKDSNMKRQDWLDEAKRQWGAPYSLSFDRIWDDCLQMKTLLIEIEGEAAVWSGTPTQVNLLRAIRELLKKWK